MKNAATAKLLGAAVAVLLGISGFIFTDRNIYAPKVLNESENAVVLETIEHYRFYKPKLYGPLSFFVLGATISRPIYHAGHCEMKVPGQFDDVRLYDYKTAVYPYTVFGIKLRTLYFGCGGSSWSTVKQ